MRPSNDLALKNKKLYLATFEFISGEYEQPFKKLFYAKNERNLEKIIQEFLIDYYGAGNTSEINDDVYYYWYGEIAVKYCGWEEISDLRKIVDRLLWE